MGYSDLILAHPNLVSYWTLNGIWTDSKGSNNLTNNGAVFSSPGKKEPQCASYDGIDDYDATGNTGFAFGTGGFTVELWGQVRVNASVTYDTFIDIGGTTNGVRLLWYNDGSYGNQLQFIIAGTNIEKVWLPSINTWYHMVALRTGTTARIYIDTVQLGADAASSGNIQPSANVYLGYNTESGDYHLNGLLGDVAVYNAALTEAEIASHFNYVESATRIRRMLSFGVSDEW